MLERLYIRFCRSIDALDHKVRDKRLIIISALQFKHSVVTTSLECERPPTNGRASRKASKVE